MTPFQEQLAAKLSALLAKAKADDRLFEAIGFIFSFSVGVIKAAGADRAETHTALDRSWDDAGAVP